MKYPKSCNVIINWIGEQVADTGCKGVVVGLSGGIDSALTGALCYESAKIHGFQCNFVTIPCKSCHDGDVQVLSDVFDWKVDVVDVEETYNALCKVLGDSIDVSQYVQANIKSRLRMIVLYAYANSRGLLVAGTTNKSEDFLGYYTKHGDAACDIEPIIELTKSEVRDMAYDMGIPDSIIEKPPSADLWHGQTDEEELGVTYDVVDKILDMHDKTRHKTSGPRCCRRKI